MNNDENSEVSEVSEVSEISESGESDTESESDSEQSQSESSEVDSANEDDGSYIKKQLVGSFNEEVFLKAATNIADEVKNDSISMKGRPKEKSHSEGSDVSIEKNGPSCSKYAVKAIFKKLNKGKKQHDPCSETDDLNTLWKSNQPLVKEDSSEQPEHDNAATVNNMFPQFDKLDTGVKCKRKLINEAGEKYKDEMISGVVPGVEKPFQFDCWTPINVNIIGSEANYLSHWPYVEDETFENELLKNYEFQLRKEDNSKISNEDLFTIVHKTRNLFGDSVQYYPSLKELGRVAKALRMGTTIDCAKRYVEACREMFPLHPEKKEKSNFEIFSENLCARCGVYCCLTHDKDDATNRPMNDGKPKDLLDCFNPDCFRKDDKIEDIQLPTTEELASWTELEKTVCQMYADDGLDDWHCTAAALLTGSKTCREVYAYSLMVKLGSQASKEKSEETEVSKSKKKDKVVSEQSKWLRHYMSTFGSNSGKTIASRYTPCNHPSEPCSTENENCQCYKNETPCDKYCSCSLACKNRFPGCKCKTTCVTNSCPCRSTGRECDPYLCDACQGSNKEENSGTCRNDGLLRHRMKRIEIGESSVHGFGGFIMESASKGDLVTEYCGEKITHAEAERRGSLYDYRRHTFLFDLNDEFVLDAAFFGSKARFINSSASPNCEPKQMYVEGDHRVGIYALRDVEAGEELFLNYNCVLIKHKMAGKTKGSAKKY